MILSDMNERIDKMTCKDMKRLTTDTPKGCLEGMLNFAIAKDNKVFLADENGEYNVDLCEYVSKLAKAQGYDFSPEDIMEEGLFEYYQEDFAVLYCLAVQAAELRERLKFYEDKLESRTLIELPCKCEKNKRGIKAWRVGENPKANDWNDEPWYKITPYTILGVSKSGKSYLVERNGWHGKRYQRYIPKRDLYVNYSESESRLKELQNG